MRLRMNGSGERVTVQGQVRTVDGRVTLIPSMPTGVDSRSGWEITVVGELSAAEGSHVSAEGTLTGDVLTLTGWTVDPGPDALYRFLRGVDGVPRDALPESDDILEEADVIGVGGGRGRGGGWWCTIHAVRLTEEIRRRVAAQPPGSVYVHGFVRDAELPALLRPAP